MLVKFVGNTSTLPISTVLYMDESDLNKRLQNMSTKLNFEYVYICHKGEAGAKDHIHLILRTKAKQFSNISKIRNDYLYEIADVDTNEYKIGDQKPCKPFVESKSIRDWYLYTMHNKEYLTKKKEIREFEYNDDDFKGDASFLTDMRFFVENQQDRKTDLQIIAEGVQSGLSDLEILNQLPLVEAQCIMATLKGISEIRKMFATDESEYLNLINKLTYNLLWHFDELGLSEVIYNHEQAYGVKLVRSEVVKHLLLTQINSIDKLDIYDACKTCRAHEKKIDLK